ncbi:hypothetical protein [Nonomuraea endophytica]|uniref:hypothetical protein n=1 Tax=Nonomuraea endophytica TaxID=714136 RepID=UPI0037C89A0D
MKALLLPADEEITDMLRQASTPHPSGPRFEPRRRPLLWRDPDNPAEQAMTAYDEWAYCREQRDLN